MLVDSGQADKWNDQDLHNMNRQKMRWQKETGEYGNEIDSSEQNLLSLHHLIGVFYMLICGITISTIFCVIEVVFRKEFSTNFSFYNK